MSADLRLRTDIIRGVTFNSNSRRAWAALAALLALAPLLILPACRGIKRAKGTTPVSVFGMFSPPTPAEAAAWATDQYDADKRYRGMLLLANAPFGGEPVYVEMYTKAATDEDPSVRAAAIRGLALHGSPEDVPTILAQLGDKDRLLRWECARALQRVHNPVAVPPLIKLLEEKNEPEAMVRSAAADALGQYAEARVLEGLITALRDRDLAVNDAGRRSLRTLTGQDFGQNFRAWVAWRRATGGAAVGGGDPFAGRQAYIYPVFHRNKSWLEWVAPIYRPPNEIASTPVGLDMASAVPAAPEALSPVPTPTEGGSIRNN